MAAQRIVLTSPWKLGLFVFLLVVGTGFGLIYSYLEVFGGQPDLENPEHVRWFYAVLGGVAVLGLLGYLATVTSARPMDRVVRGSKSQQKVLKSLAKVQDAREVDPEDFKEISAVATALERWRDDARAAQDAGLELAETRERIAELESAIEEARREADDARQQADSQPQPAAPAAAGVDPARVNAVAQTLRGKQREIGNFIESIGDCAADLSQRVTPGPTSGPVSPGDPSEVLGAMRQNVEKLGAVRSTLDDLAEEANKLAITAALQISRLGDGAEEIVGTAEEIRALSTRFQRIAADLRVCESDQSATVQKAGSALGSGGASASPVEGLDAIVMVLDQSTEGLSEVLGQLVGSLAQLESLATGDSAATPTAEVQAPAAEADPAPSAPAPAAPDEAATRGPVPAAEPSLDVDPPAEAPAEAEVYDIAELGGREIGDPEGDEEVYDLEKFGAVEL